MIKSRFTPASGRSRMSFLPHADFPLIHTVAQVESGGPFDNNITTYVHTKDVASQCSIQPMTAAEIQVLPEGIKKDAVYTLYTNSPVYAEEDGTDFVGSSIYIPNSWWQTGDSNFITPFKQGWFKVIQAKNWGNNIRNHYEATIVKDTTVTDDQGNMQYPDMTTFDTYNRETFLSGAWEDSWLGGV